MISNNPAKAHICMRKLGFKGEIFDTSAVSTRRGTMPLLVMSTLERLEDRYYIFHFDSFLIHSLIMHCSILYMITSLITQSVSQSFFSK